MTSRSLAALSTVFVTVFVLVLAGACKKTSNPPSADSVCKSDEDCTFSCESRGQCCANPYCEAVLHKGVAADALAFNRQHCTKEDFEKCPSVGARGTPRSPLVPRCRAGACVAERVPQADAVPVTDSSAPLDAVDSSTAAPVVSYDRSCTHDRDCVPARGCCPTPCTSLVINRKDLPKMIEQNASVCPPGESCVSAGGCRAHAYLCVKKQCQLVYADSPDYRTRRE